MSVSSPELAASRSRPAWRQRLSTFWRWWLGEIAQILPERFAALGGAARVPWIAFEGDDALLVQPRAGAGEQRVMLGALDDAGQRTALRAMLERAGETLSRATVCLGHDEALVRRVTMPAATEENLGQVLGFEMDRLTPFHVGDVYFDHRVLSRDAGAGTIQVLLAVARLEIVDSHVARLRALGVNVQGVTVRDEVAHAGPPLDLLPSEQRGERESSRERVVKRALAVAVAVLFAIALLLPAWQKRETIISLHPQVAKAQQEATATDALARQLETQVADYNFLLEKKHAYPPAIAYVEDISRLLPDNTWVQQLDVKTVGKGREVQITGETASSSKLIEILEQSTMLQNATPRGTVTRGSTPGSERFMIAAETRPRPLPEAQNAAEAAAGAPPATGSPPKPAAAPAPAPAAAKPAAAPPKGEPPKAAPKAPGK